MRNKVPTKKSGVVLVGHRQVRQAGKRHIHGHMRSSGVGVTTSNKFVGPTVNGGDTAYVKVYTGKVTEKKPSFA